MRPMTKMQISKIQWIIPALTPTVLRVFVCMHAQPRLVTRWSTSLLERAVQDRTRQAAALLEFLVLSGRAGRKTREIPFPPFCSLRHLILLLDPVMAMPSYRSGIMEDQEAASGMPDLV
ncbi:hypothetical protein MPTK1_3g17780 [Marchantia polymorpha subsp. ruderalis]|uniref:Uncharacterized protein n=2 Tax=Marchantia polymorpha TaxID=3197 RepID=A0AAF6B1Z1_MARPO|nr:hypothetical protein MARPO_0039s0018 [Marchantia polymorpha]BBN06025.1 hypothetical protein Mp_3g17780 [Marchantia polymorpha subsp. ruderalis]|eukprot:PTQ40503.1 hypothetical protein MARPO_0039s0018 [Marchantia polymorpha]